MWQFDHVSPRLHHNVTKKKPPAEGRGLVPDAVIAKDQRE
jgi:hypothetical protein